MKAVRMIIQTKLKDKIRNDDQYDIKNTKCRGWDISRQQVFETDIRVVLVFHRANTGPSVCFRYCISNTEYWTATSPREQSLKQRHHSPQAVVLSDCTIIRCYQFTHNWEPVWFADEPPTRDGVQFINARRRQCVDYAWACCTRCVTYVH